MGIYGVYYIRSFILKGSLGEQTARVPSQGAPTIRQACDDMMDPEGAGDAGEICFVSAVRGKTLGRAISWPCGWMDDDDDDHYDDDADGTM